jgi:hypothetical protein
MAQEPDANSAVKAFAAKYLELGPQSNVVMLSKSTVNEPRCAAAGGCTPDSTSCCRSNNGIYEYLQGQVPGKCDWNFNKYPVGKDGVPNGKRYGDDVYAADLETDIDALLSEM